MAEITSYVIVNGDVSEQHPYEHSVNNQKEIERHRESVSKLHHYKTGDYNIVFALKLLQSEVGRFHT